MSIFGAGGTNNASAMKMIFDQVTRQAEVAKPPLEQDQWRAVLKVMISIS